LGTVKALDIISPGPLTTVQDLGRPGYGAYGVPPSGAVDSLSLRMGNLLVGNPENTAGLEITLMGLQVRVLCDILVAVTGGDLQTRLNDRPLAMWTAVRLRTGDVISFNLAKTGCRAYLAVGGGIEVPDVMNSASTNLGSGFGGLDGRALGKGDILSVKDPQSHLAYEGNALDEGMIPSYPNNWCVRVIWGPQDQDFTQEAKDRFLNASFTVTSESDRAGIRLKGPELPAKDGLASSIISEGVIPGAIQVPGSGLPIILLGETVTGGYRKIATVISADIPFLGQMKPGDRVSFEPVELPVAHTLLKKRGAQITDFKNKVVRRIQRC